MRRVLASASPPAPLLVFTSCHGPCLQFTFVHAGGPSPPAVFHFILTFTSAIPLSVINSLHRVKLNVRVHRKHFCVGSRTNGRRRRRFLQINFSSALGFYETAYKEFTEKRNGRKVNLRKYK